MSQDKIVAVHLEAMLEAFARADHIADMDTFLLDFEELEWTFNSQCDFDSPEGQRQRWSEAKTLGTRVWLNVDWTGRL